MVLRKDKWFYRSISKCPRIGFSAGYSRSRYQRTLPEKKRFIILNFSGYNCNVLTEIQAKNWTKTATKKSEKITKSPIWTFSAPCNKRISLAVEFMSIMSNAKTLFECDLSGLVSWLRSISGERRKDVAFLEHQPLPFTEHSFFLCVKEGRFSYIDEKSANEWFIHLNFE